MGKIINRITEILVVLLNLFYLFSVCYCPFQTKYISIPASILSFTELEVNCTKNSDVGALMQFAFQHNGTHALYKYECSFTSQISRTVLSTKYTDWNDYTDGNPPEKSFNLLDRHFVDCSSIDNSAINSFVMEFDSNLNKIRYRYLCVNVKGFNLTNTDSSSVIYSNISCPNDSIYYLKSMIGPGDSTDEALVLSNFKIVNLQPSCSSQYNYKVETICNSACKGCNTNSPVLDCIDCADNHYKKFDIPSECYNIKPNGYYLDSSASPNVFIRCFSFCKECLGPGTQSNTNCINCSDGFYPLEDRTSQCLNSVLSGYWFDTMKNRYSLCYYSCLTCNTGGNSTFHNCDNCNTNFYPLDTNSSQCYSESTKLQNIILISKKYYFCFSSCGSCLDVGSSVNHKCITCATNYLPLIDDKTMCYNTAPDGYYIDTNENAYKKCYSSCATCFKDGNETLHNCLSCRSNNILYKSNCYFRCPDGYEEKDKKCKSCLEMNKYYFNSICVSSCPDTYIPNNNFCVLCSKKVWNEKCINSCPPGSIELNENHCIKINNSNISILFNKYRQFNKTNP